MKFILKLLKEILNRVSNLYSNESVDELLSSKVSKEDSDGAIEGLAKSRKDNDDIVQGLINSNKSYDEALANVIKWQSYAASMQSAVDENTAIQIAEEFEKATEEYLKDPTATKEWMTTKNEDGTGTSTNPYYKTAPSKPIVDFLVSRCTSQTISLNCFADGTNVVMLLPNVIWTRACFSNSKFNSLFFAPNTTDCGYMFNNSTLFNQPLNFPRAGDCSYMFRNATSFNQPLSLPNATNCECILFGATSFNSELILPKANKCNSMLEGAKSFNQPLSLPSATNVGYAFASTSALNSPVYIPKASVAIGAFLKGGMSAENIAVTLDSLQSDPVGKGGTGVITFTGCPGVASTATNETFTVTDTDGTEYSLDNCHIFTTDDENQTLRKSYVLAVAKKGWDVQI